MTKEQIEEKHKNPIPAVDFMISKDGNSKILLARHKKGPYKGLLSIPGGFINEGETAEDTMMREVKEETSLILEPLAILGVYSGPSRDPRMHTISLAFITRIVKGKEAANDDAAHVQWIKIEGDLDRLIETNQIAFNHSKILTDFRNWIRMAEDQMTRILKIFLHFDQQIRERVVQKKSWKLSPTFDICNNNKIEFIVD
jgi:8-oxo-dGTP diphosphatase